MENTIFRNVFIGSLIGHILFISSNSFIPDFFNKEKKIEKFNVIAYMPSFIVKKSQEQEIKKTPDFTSAIIKKVEISKRIRKKVKSDIRNTEFFKENRNNRINKRPVKRIDERSLNLELNRIGNEQEKVFLHYFDRLKIIIMSKLDYPGRAAMDNIKGDVNVFFTLDRSGVIKKVHINNPSRYNVLNNTSVDVIRGCSPFPVFPEDINKDKLDFSVTISYRL